MERTRSQTPDPLKPKGSATGKSQNQSLSVDVLEWYHSIVNARQQKKCRRVGPPISSARGGVLLIALSICISVLGCKGLILRLGLDASPRTAWSVESRSPDGKMVATARAEETSGIGTGNPGTSVYLNWTTGSQPPNIILFLVPDQSGAIKVGMKWLDPTHLELTYSGHAIVDFEAVKCHSVDISLRGVPMPKVGAPAQ
jgi:hypothetical protein